MPNHHKSPLLPAYWMPLPLGGSNHVVDFWSGFFEAEPGTLPQNLEQFPQAVADCLESMDYPGDTDGKPRLVSFSGGLIGVGRRMLVFENTHAKAMVYFKRIQDWQYVSLRVVYPQPLSLLKMLRFIAIVLGLLLLILIAGALETYSYRYYRYSSDYNYRYQSTQEYVARYIFDTFTQNPFEMLLAAFFIALPLFLTWGGISWWRTGKFLGFLREDFQEVYRDDLASIGRAAYYAILMAADELSLTAFVPDNAETPTPQFAAVTSPGATATRRVPRI